MGIGFMYICLSLSHYYSLTNLIVFSKITILLKERVFDSVFLLKEFSPSLAALAAIFNLALVIYFFNSNKDEAKYERELARKSYWYRDVILNKNLPLVTENYWNINSVITGLTLTDCNDDTLKKVINEISILKRNIIDNFNDLIKVMDEDFSDQLDEFLDDFEDVYTEKIEDLLTTPNNEWNFRKEELLKDVLASKNSFLKKLYTFEQRGYNA